MTSAAAKEAKAETLRGVMRERDAAVKLCAAQADKIHRLERELERLRKKLREVVQDGQ